MKALNTVPNKWSLPTITIISSLPSHLCTAMTPDPKESPRPNTIYVILVKALLSSYI